MTGKDMLDILKAAVYCGTYRKYANGDISGSWMPLVNYRNSKEFLEACKKLHAGESDPEFMYQDSEYLPDEFYSESCIYPEVFEVIQAIKGMTEDEANAFAKYCNENAAIPEMFDVEEFKRAYKAGLINSESSSTSSALEELLEIIKQKDGSDYKGYYVAAIKVKDGYFVKFTKQELEKSFCWGYSDFQGMTEDEANELCANFGEKEFKEENLARFDRKYKDELEQLGRYADVTLWCNEWGKGVYMSCGPKSKFSTPDPEHELTLRGEDANKFRKEYTTTVASLRAKFEKRIDSYLKRYGVSKIRKWTFWADE